MVKQAFRGRGNRAKVWIETMEDRTLLSTAALIAPVANSGAVVVGPIAPLPPVPVAPVVGVPVTFQAVVGVAYTGDVALLKPAAVPANTAANTTAYRGTIAWGDSNAATAATFVLGTDGLIHVQGTHTYSQASTFGVTVTVTPTAATASGTPAAIVIKSTAVVSQNSTGGVTIIALPGKPFTGIVGTFQLPPTATPAAGAANTSPLPTPLLSASINWGNGQVTTGQIVGNAANGSYSVVGTETYKAAGTYRITITVTERFTPMGPSILLTTIDSTAVVGPTPVAT